jgi:hypothetical protein
MCNIQNRTIQVSQLIKFQNIFMSIINVQDTRVSLTYSHAAGFSTKMAARAVEAPG